MVFRNYFRFFWVFRALNTSMIIVCYQTQLLGMLCTTKATTTQVGRFHMHTRSLRWSNRWRFSCHSYLRTRRNRQAWLRQKTADSLIYHSWFIGKDNSCDRDRPSGLGKLNWSRTLRSKHRRRVPHGKGGATDLVPPAAAGDTRNQVLITVHMTEVETQTRGHVCTLRSSAPCSLRARISHPRPPSSN